MISLLAFISPYLSIDCGFVHFQYPRNFSLLDSYSQTCIYLVSLFLGKLQVTHKRSFDSSGLKGRILLQLTFLPLALLYLLVEAKIKIRAILIV